MIRNLSADEYDFQNLKYSQEVNIREIESLRMSTCQCKDEHLISCKIGGFIRIIKAHHGRHTKKHHGPSPKPPVEESDDKYEGEASNKEGEDDEVSQIEKTELAGTTLPGKQVLLTTKCKSESDIPDSEIDEENDTSTAITCTKTCVCWLKSVCLRGSFERLVGRNGIAT